MERTEKRVRNDLLGAGPKTVEDLRNIYRRIREKYIKVMERQERIAQRKMEKAAAAAVSNGTNSLIRGLFPGKPETVPKATTEMTNNNEEKQHSDVSSAVNDGNFSIDDDEDDWISANPDVQS